MQLKNLQKSNARCARMKRLGFQNLNPLTTKVCAVIDENSLQLPQKSLRSVLKWRCVEGSSFCLAFQEVAFHFEENRQLLRVSRVQMNTIDMRDAHTFWPAIVIFRALLWSKDDLVF